MNKGGYALYSIRHACLPKMPIVGGRYAPGAMRAFEQGQLFLDEPKTSLTGIPYG